MRLQAFKCHRLCQLIFPNHKRIRVVCYWDGWSKKHICVCNWNGVSFGEDNPHDRIISLELKRPHGPKTSWRKFMCSSQGRQILGKMLPITKSSHVTTFLATLVADATLPPVALHDVATPLSRLIPKFWDCSRWPLTYLCWPLTYLCWPLTYQNARFCRKKQI